MEFKVGDKITAFQGGQTYKAKVLGVRKSNGEVELKVHYQGWKARWDEWIGLDRAGRDGHPPPAQVRADEEAARKAEEAAAEAARQKALLLENAKSNPSACAVCCAVPLLGAEPRVPAAVLSYHVSTRDRPRPIARVAWRAQAR